MTYRRTHRFLLALASSTAGGLGCAGTSTAVEQPSVMQLEEVGPRISAAELSRNRADLERLEEITREIERVASIYAERVQRVERAADELRTIADQTQVTSGAVDRSVERAVQDFVIALPENVPVEFMPEAAGALRTLSQEYPVVTAPNAVATATRLQIRELHDEATTLRAAIDERLPPGALGRPHPEVTTQQARFDRLVVELEDSTEAARQTLDEVEPRARYIAMELVGRPTRVAARGP